MSANPTSLATVLRGPWAQASLPDGDSSNTDSLASRTLDVFTGVLPSAWPGYAAREGQMKLTRAFAETIERGGVMLGEGPCGTGKSLAYLVPAILHADREGRTVLVVTASIALQEQLVAKDLPALASALAPVLEHPLTFALLKGRGNYLCKNTVDEPAPPYLTVDERNELAMVDDWAATTTTGDRGDLPLIVRDGVWQLRTVSTDECLRDGCDFFGECHARAAKARAQSARVVVVNYALLFAHVAVHREMFQDVVVPTTGPQGSEYAWDTVIYDEAHEAADKARDALGAEIGEHAFRSIATWIRKHAVPTLADREEPPTDTIEEWEQAARDLEARAATLWCEMDARMPLPQPGERVDPHRLREGLPTDDLHEAVERARSIAGSVASAASKAARIAKDIGADETPHRKVQRRAENTGRRASRIASWLSAAAVPAESPQVVLWIDRHENPRKRTTTLTLNGAFIDVGPILRAELWRRTRATVLTSATLTTGEGVGGWEWVRGRLGLSRDDSSNSTTNVSTIAVPSPFDFARQALLCLPMAPPLPDPTKAREAFDAAVCQVLLRTARAARGRTLGLFTSTRMARRAAEYLRAQHLPWPVLCQGEEPRAVLVERMKREPAILCGTTSLWTGVDLPGEAVVAVVIDKVPFPAPGDPVLDALGEIATARTGNTWAGFREQSLPRASLSLRQGVGRLIRSVTDWGAVVICDPRMVSKGYGSEIARALAMPAQVRSLGAMEQWFAGRSGAGDVRGDL